MCKEPNANELTLNALAIEETIESAVRTERGDKDKVCRLLSELDRLPKHPFGTHLMRRIRVKTGEEHASAKRCKEILYAAFARKNIPFRLPSITEDEPPYEEPDKAKKERVIEGWLSADTVNRLYGAPILIGFALDLTLEEVNELYSKGIGQTELHPKSGYEAIAIYCFNNRILDFENYRRYIFDYLEQCDTGVSLSADRESSLGRYGELLDCAEEWELMDYLRLHPVTFARKTDPSVFAHQTVTNLYNEIAELAKPVLRYAYGHLDEICPDFSPAQVENLLYGVEQECTSNNNYLKDFCLQEALMYVCPRNEGGNVDFAGSVLNDKDKIRFLALTRQALNMILKEKTEKNNPRNTPRDAILTLCFLKWALRNMNLALESENSRYTRLSGAAFKKEANELLSQCGFECMRAVNPFDCFLMVLTAEKNPLMLYRLAWTITEQDLDDFAAKDRLAKK